MTKRPLYYGQLGDNSFEARSKPVQVLGENGIGYLNLGIVQKTYTLSRTSFLSFQPQSEGYKQSSANGVTIWNTGNTANINVTATLSGKNATAFVLNKTNLGIISPQGKSNLTVRPKAGLSAGTYTAMVTVKGTGINNNLSFNVNFIVNPKSQSINVDFYMRTANKNTKLNIEWDDSFFKKSAKTYNNDLAIASLILSESAYRLDSVKKTLTTFGFNDFKSHNYGLWNATNVGHSFSKKKIGNDTVIAIVIRGTPYTQWHKNSEWIGNASGFDISKSYVIKNLNSYIQKINGLTINNVKFLITGHSRGAAVSNLLGAELSKKFGANNVYTYCFASPNVTSNNKRRYNESNIYNLVNNDDTVPKQPPFFVSLDSTKNGRIDIFEPYPTTDGDKHFTKLTGLKYSKNLKDAPHSLETYLAYLLISKKLTISNKTNDKIITIKCPVNIEIYNNEGKLVGRIKKNKVDKKVKGDVSLYIKGDTKYAYLPNNEIYKFKLTGTKKGKMNYIVSTVNIVTSKVTKQKEFKNVTLTKGKTFTTEIEKPKNSKLFVTKKGRITAEVSKKGKETPKTQLSKSSKLKLTSKKATWKKVNNNSGYFLKIMQGKKVIKIKQIKKGQTSYKIPKKLLKKGKSYSFTLVAKGKGKYANSKTIKSRKVIISKRNKTSAI